MSGSQGWGGHPREVSLPDKRQQLGPYGETGWTEWCPLFTFLPLVWCLRLAIVQTALRCEPNY